jgi:hypothetical protein
MERKRRGPETAERRAQAEALANTGALISLFALRSWRNDRVRETGKPECAGLNRHVVGDARALQERK